MFPRHFLLPMLLTAGIGTTLAQQPDSVQLKGVPGYANIAIGAHHRADDGALVSPFNLGIFGCVDSLRGMQVAVFSAITARDMSGLDIGGLYALGGGNVSGVQVGGLVNSVARTMHGVQLGGVSNVAGQLHGVQVAAFSNISCQPMRGLQIASITNISMGVKRGMQVAGISNISNGYMRGLQLGTYNYADTLNGSQVGLINVAVSHPRGVQVGLVNYSRDTEARKIGLVNINPTTDIDVMLYGGNTSKLNMAMRFRNRSTYSIVGIGTHYMGLDKKFSGALSYRLGQYFPVGRRWTISGDLGLAHVETFEENSRSKPERLYSLQARINADYQINKTLGAFASVGYANTRHYGSDRLFEDKLIAELGVSVGYGHHNRQNTAMERRMEREDSLRNALGRIGLTLPGNGDSRFALPVKKRYWTAAAEATGINLLVFSFDRFVMNEDFAQVNIHTIRDNFKRGFVWDNDPFATNLFAHPYHGNLYFNSARSNGLTFWESVPYAIGGSLMWEMLAECEPPAINDWLATSMGGTCIGEITNRISRLILDDSKRGGARFLREAAAFLVNPMQGLNRLMRGEATRVRSSHHLYHDHDRIPVSLALSLGDRYLADDGGLFRGEHNPYVNVNLEYGDVLCDEENKPYDFFAASVTLGLSGNQPLLNTAHLLGRLWGAPIYAGKEVDAQLGIYQHFNFYNSEPVKDGTSLTPYRISEAVAFGPGMVYRFHPSGSLSHIEQRIFLDGIVLGGSKSDYYNVIDRDYNMGSGYSFKTQTCMVFPRVGSFTFKADYYRIFTWKGYETKDLEGENPLYYNVQGDKSNAELLVLNPAFCFNLKGGMAVALSGSYFIRKTRYSYHNDVQANTFEIKAGLVCQF